MKQFTNILKTKPSNQEFHFQQKYPSKIKVKQALFWNKNSLAIDLQYKKCETKFFKQKKIQTEAWIYSV
jgi:hypothetical protein